MMQGRMFRLIVGAFLLLLTTTASVRSNAQLPPNSNAYGHSLTEWMTKYITWYFLGGPDSVGHVKFMPIPGGNYVGGSGSPEDPAVFEGHLDVTLKSGTAFVLPIAFLQGESYLPEVPVIYNPDPPIPDAAFEGSNILITMDGKTIINSATEDKFRYYVPTTYFDSPLVYSQPTNYGATAALFFQGYGFVHQPLSKGTHTMTLESSILFPADIYANAIFGFGVKFVNSWTITVK